MTEYEQRLIASISKSMALICVRDTMLEDIHAGIERLNHKGRDGGPLAARERIKQRNPDVQGGPVGKSKELPRMLHKSLVRELARPFNVGLFEYIGACVFASHG